MPVSQHETALSRGRIPSYLRRQYYQLLLLLMEGGARRNRRCRLLSQFSVTWSASLNHSLVMAMEYSSQRSSSRFLNSLTMALYNHCTSYDMHVRPTLLFDYLPFDDPIAELVPTEFYELSGFWPDQFTEIINNLTLLPERIVCPITRCYASKQLAIFVMLRRWKKSRQMGGCFPCHEKRACLVYQDLPCCIFIDFTALQKVGPSFRLQKNYPTAGGVE